MEYKPWTPFQSQECFAGYYRTAYQGSPCTIQTVPDTAGAPWTASSARPWASCLPKKRRLFSSTIFPVALTRLFSYRRGAVASPTILPRKRDVGEHRCEEISAELRSES